MAINIKRATDYYTGNGIPKATDFNNAGGLNGSDIYRDIDTDTFYRYTGSGFVIEQYPFGRPVAGATGRGITNSDINPSGQLVLTYSDSTTQTPGVVVGAKGNDGITPTFITGTTTTLDPGSPATATIRPVGALNQYAIDLGIPKGFDGGASGAVQSFDSFYQFFTTTSFQLTVLKYFDGVSKMGGGLFQWLPGATFPTIIGQCVNRGSGCFVRLDSANYNLSWCASQRLPMKELAKPISQYPGSISQSACDQMFGAGFINVTTDTYDYLSLKYTFSIMSKEGYAAVDFPNKVFQINKEVSLPVYYEVLPGHDWSNMPQDRRTEICAFYFNMNGAIITSINTTAMTYFKAAMQDFKTEGWQVNRSYNFEKGVFYSAGQGGTNLNDCAIDIRGCNGSTFNKVKAYGFGTSLNLSFAMHTEIDACDFGQIQGKGVILTYKGIANGDPPDTPSNGSVISNSHFSSATSGTSQWAIYCEEVDAFEGFHNSFEGGAAAGNYYIEALSNFVKGAEIRNIRNEHLCTDSIVKINAKEGWFEVAHIWDQSESVYVSGQFSASGNIHVIHTDYLSSTGLKMRMCNGAFFNFECNFGINNIQTQPGSKIKWDNTLGGIAVPDQSRYQITGLRWNQ